MTTIDNPPPAANAPRLQVKVKDAAVMLGVCRRTIRRLADQGVLVWRGEGRLARIDYQSILDYHERGRQR